MLASVALGSVLLTACAPMPTDPVADEPRAPDALPSYCAPSDSGDDPFWELVHSSCRVAQDGDLAQAEALRQALEEVPVEDVAQFQRRLVATNRALLVAADVADDICAPGLGLGDDLGVDYRSWIISHGQAAVDAVLADAEVLRVFPDAEAGCGLGEPFGGAAYELYLERTGLSPRKAGLPTIEDASR